MTDFHDDKAHPMVAVHECYAEAEGQVVAGVLREEGIQVLVQSDPPKDVYPLTAGELARVLVYVPEEDEARARAAIDAHLSSPNAD